MTEIDVPDWVVKAADEAGDEFDRTHTMSMYASVSDMWLDRVRHMLTAALGAWVVPVACAARWEIEILNNTTVNSAEAWSLDTLDAHDVTLFTLRQEKPE